MRLVRNVELIELPLFPDNTDRTADDWYECSNCGAWIIDNSDHECKPFDEDGNFEEEMNYKTKAGVKVHVTPIGNLVFQVECPGGAVIQLGQAAFMSMFEPLSDESGDRVMVRRQLVLDLLQSIKDKIKYEAGSAYDLEVKELRADLGLEEND